MKKKIVICLAVLLSSALLVSDYILTTEDAWAGRSRSSFSRSGSSFSRLSPSRSVWGSRSGGGIFKKTSSSSGYAKPSSSKKSYKYAKPKSAVPGSTSSKKYKKPDKAASSGSGGYAKPKKSYTASSFSGTKYDRKKIKKIRKTKSAQSLKAYKAEKAKYKKSASKPDPKQFRSSPIYNKTQRYGSFDYNDHYTRRNGYYHGMGWSMPSYGYLSRPGFGMWDVMFWWMILDHVGNRNYAATAYHHSNDPGYKEWRAEAERLAEDNAQIREKLKKLDQETASMRTPRDPGYLPSGVPAEVALAADVMASKKSERPLLRMATASKTGNYNYFGTKLAGYAEGVNVELRNSNGSMENLRLLMNDEVDAALIQSDAFAVYQKKFPNSHLISEQTVLYKEAVQMIANKKSGIKYVDDIDPDRHFLIVGPKGSGTALTWEAFCMEDSGYRKIRTMNMAYPKALKEVEKNPDAVMMFVSGLNSPLLKEAEKMAGETSNLRLVAVDDWDFNDTLDQNGNRVYTFTTIPTSIYPNLQKGFIFDRDIETLAVDSVLVVRTDWVEKYGVEAMDALSFAVMETQPHVARRVQGLE